MKQTADKHVRAERGSGAETAGGKAVAQHSAPPTAAPATLHEARQLVARAAAARHADRLSRLADAHEPMPWPECSAGPCEAACSYVYGALDGRYVAPSGCERHPLLDADEDPAACSPDRPCTDGPRCTCSACVASHVERGIRLAALLAERPAKPRPGR